MDRAWMSGDQLSDEYEEGIDEFIAFAKSFANENGEEFVHCPCKKCWNVDKVRVTELKDHLGSNGIDPSYKVWDWHGEKVRRATPSSVKENHNDEYYMVQDDELVDMIHNIKEDFSKRPDILDSLLGDAKKPLYPGCTKITLLSAVLKLFTVKAANGWSDKSFTDLLKVMKAMLPDGNDLPSRTYDAKKILCPMGINYEKIHACPNDCILYRNEFHGLHQCPKCDAPRYKLKKDGNVTATSPPAKVLWYLPIIPRFKRMFANARDAKNLRWHADRKIQDDKLRHVADSPQWKTIDFKFSDFGKEPRNLRLGLCTDGMNPHGNLSSNHSTWPVLLVIYNLPPWLCMKRKHMMLSLLISGPKQPGNDIDVYLAPLIEDLKKLWEEGVAAFDAYRQESFTLRAMIFCTINDFPAYGNLSGNPNKGHKACPICGDATCHFQLKHGRKTVYLNHRRFLSRHHPYRKLKKAFNGEIEEGIAPVILSGRQVYEAVKDITNEFGKPNKAPKEKTLWKKRSIFFDLPYWKDLFVRHSLDVMHVEKNICDSLLGTLLNIPGKTKDGVKARLDMVDMSIRAELAPEKKGQRTYLPPACYTLSKKEKKSFIECLHGVKVPQGYSSNIRSLVSVKDLKLVGLKSHDCHVLMQQLLPVAIRDILPKKVRHTITRLCFFFKAICSKVIDPNKLDDLQRDVIEILCQLEMYFPPSFFDIMVHLTVHLVREVKLCGPVFMRWMYPCERIMKVMKGFVRNRYRPEGCIVEGYIAEEILEFTNDYLSDTKAIGLPESRHGNRIEGENLRGLKVITVTLEERDQAHLYVLHNVDEVKPYIDEHLTLIRRHNRGKRETWVKAEHNRTFITWFDNRVSAQLKENPKSVSETIRWLSTCPSVNIWSYGGYDINGYTFYTKDWDDKDTMQNSGVTLVAEAMHVSSSKDKNPILAKMAYYGVIENIWELDYVKLRVPIFRCRWVQNTNGVRVDELGFTLVDLSREGHKEEPFIMASQARQIFYVSDPANKKWSVVLQGKRQVVGDDEGENLDDIEEIPSFSLGLPQMDLFEDDVQGFYVRDDHGEGLWAE